MSLKGRNFDIVLYKDSSTYEFNSVMEKAISMCNINNWSYYYIEHDKDFETKVHTHFTIICPSNGSDFTIKSIADVLGIKEEYIEKKNRPKECILYLAHKTKNSMDKYQYDWHDIETNNQTKLREVFANDEELANLCIIIDYIDNCSYINYIDFAKFVLDNSLWSYYRRSGAIINNIIHEHNNKFMQYKRNN